MRSLVNGAKLSDLKNTWKREGKIYLVTYLFLRGKFYEKMRTDEDAMDRKS